MDRWTLAYDDFDPAQEATREALCALGNGYLVTRGAAPESRADGTHYPGSYLAGCYNRLSSAVGGRTLEDESIVNAPNWLPLTFAIDDGDWFDLAAVDILELHQELDLRRGLLTRRIRFADRPGRASTLTQRRFVHMRHPHLAGLQTTVVAENWSGRLRIRAGIDGTVTNSGVARYRDLACRHLTVLAADTFDEGVSLMVAETNQSHVRIAVATRTRLVGGPADPPAWQGHRDGDLIDHELTLEITAGNAAVTVEKIAALYTSRDQAISEPGSAALDAVRAADPFDDLVRSHVLAWSELWDRFMVRFDGGDPRKLTAVRLHTFHLLQTISPHSIDLDIGLPARGLHGEAYRGHVFWDELFVLPILNIRAPELARAVLRYRYRRLPAARRAARAEGRSGAMFPWQSGSDGREESARLHLNPRSGRWLPDPTYLQRHIGIAVAYNTWQYHQATTDHDFLSRYGAEMILETARFLAGLAHYDHGRDRYVIRGVIGPDEFHTGYPQATTPGVDNNAYTNVMTSWTLRRALELLPELPSWRRTELVETLGLHAHERARWEDIAGKMFVPFHHGVLSQFEGYHRLDELDWDSYRTRYGNIQRLDRILEAEGDDINRYQASKQADVLMLFYLLSADELGELLDGMGYRLDPGTIPRTIEYYLARTSHGSTLSAVVHAWVLARAHRTQAMDYFDRALDSDIADVQGGTTAEGIHLAAMAGSLDVLQRCFAGVETRQETLWLNPSWPAQLGPLELRLRYREHLLAITIRGSRVRVRSHPGPHHPVRVACRDQVALVAPGETAQFGL